METDERDQRLKQTGTTGLVRRRDPMNKKWNDLQEGYRKKLAVVLQYMSEIPDSELSKFISKTRMVRLARGELFTKTGEPTNQIGFIGKGSFRTFYADDQGKEFIKTFLFENEYIGSYTSLLNGWNAAFNTESLEKSDILVIDFSDFSDLMNAHVCWQIVGRKVAEALFRRCEQRERELLVHSVKKRYLNFLQNYPQAESRLKQHQIAAYIGVAPVHLSRVKKELKLNG